MTAKASTNAREYLPAGKTLWVLFDMSNGDKSARRYLWWFDTRKAARAHRASQTGTPGTARLSAVVKVRVAHVERT